MHPPTEPLVAALTEIRRMAMDHPCFHEPLFEKRDFNGLEDQGGDCCDWTMVAIIADDALKSVNKTA